MKRIRAIIVFLLAVSLPLPVFASASSTPHCDMKATAADPGSLMTMGAASDESADPNCCDCSEAAACNAPCVMGAAFVPHTFGNQAVEHTGKSYFIPAIAGIPPAPPTRLLRPPISLS